MYSNSNQANALRIGFELLHQLEGWDKYELAMEAYSHIDEIVAEGKENCLPAAREWAQKVKDEPVFFVLASRPQFRGGLLHVQLPFYGNAVEIRHLHALGRIFPRTFRGDGQKSFPWF